MKEPSPSLQNIICNLSESEKKLSDIAANSLLETDFVF